MKKKDKGVNPNKREVLSLEDEEKLLAYPSFLHGVLRDIMSDGFSVEEAWELLEILKELYKK